MFEIGDIIRFKYTGIAAEIIEDYADGSYAVWLTEDDEESIAFADDIVLEKDFKKIEESEQQKMLKKAPKGLTTEELFYSKSELEAKKRVSLQQKQVKKIKLGTTEEEQDKFIAPPIVPSPPSQLGAYLVFYPTSPNNYTIYLVNDSLLSFRFEFKLFLRQTLFHGFNKLIPANTFFPIGEFLQEHFNDSPHIEFKCPNFKFKKSIKLKYKKFIGSQQAVPLMGLSTYSFQLFKKLDPPQKKHISIADYTKDYKKVQEDLIEPIYNRHRSFDLMDVASFGTELDLHAEKLVNDTSEFSSTELYNIQLEALDSFISKAIAMDISEVFVIHGIGKGKLQQGVNNYLRFHGDVKSYNNEFHDKFGFGATRVIFK